MILRDHNYDQLGTANRWRHPHSKSGGYGGSIKAFGGVERFFSHNGNDLLCHENLPDWCGVRAVDAFDAVCILDFGGDRAKALLKLGTQIGALKPIERKALARLIHNMVDDDASQAEIEDAAFRHGEELGLTRAEVIQVAVHVAGQRSAA